MASAIDVFQESITIAIAPITQPGKCGLKVRQQRLNLLLRRTPAQGLSKQNNPQLGGIDCAVVQRRQAGAVIKCTGLHQRLSTQFMHDFAGISIGLNIGFSSLEVRQSTQCAHRGTSRQRQHETCSP